MSCVLKYLYLLLESFWQIYMIQQHPLPQKLVRTNVYRYHIALQNQVSLSLILSAQIIC